METALKYVAHCDAHRQTFAHDEVLRTKVLWLNVKIYLLLRINVNKKKCCDAWVHGLHKEFEFNLARFTSTEKRRFSSF